MPSLARWPGKFPAGIVSNEIMSHMDWLPTLLAAAGEPDIIEKLKAGHQAGEKTFKVHLDGHNFLPYLTGKQKRAQGRVFLLFGRWRSDASLRQLEDRL